ncbi:hypothetical protein LUCX_193 [Xanthomonas phage vB_XciM_LucasX]|nr:hypothetical protein LUCX_193 [Xanthomonas phage vB_XciM_LucasX]
MSTAVRPCVIALAKENAKIKKKYLTIEHAPASQLPHRVVKTRTGVVLASFKTEGEMVTFIENYPVEDLMVKPSRKRFSR